ncbi:MAG: hypothetical protein RL748_2498 [Pseudomonadota bacterium]|jgi:hypothetical protein
MCSENAKTRQGSMPTRPNDDGLRMPGIVVSQYGAGRPVGAYFGRVWRGWVLQNLSKVCREGDVGNMRFVAELAPLGHMPKLQNFNAAWLDPVT